jgi:hypothetical protein
VGAQGKPCSATISGLLCVPICFLIIPDLSTGALWQLRKYISGSKEGEICGKKWQLNFSYEVSLL